MTTAVNLHLLALYIFTQEGVERICVALVERMKTHESIRRQQREQNARLSEQ